MLGWKKHKLESRLLGEISRNADMQMTESEEELKSLYAKFQKYPNITKQRGTKESLDKGERGEGKNWLKTQHSKN